MFRQRLRPLLVDQAPRVWIALLRLLIGLVFLTVVCSNFTNGFYSAEGLERFFGEVFPQSENPLRWYAAFIAHVIMPRRAGFAVLQAVAEPLMGLGLLLGLFTPLVAGAAMVFILNTFLATFGQDWPWSYILIEAILFTVVVTQAGRTAGLDRQLARRFGPDKWFLW